MRNDGKWPAVLFPLHADGGFCLVTMDAHGGLIASALDLANFFSTYQISGKTWANSEQTPQTFLGSLPGTWSMVYQRADDIQIVALFNQRTSPPGYENQAILDMLNRAVDQVTAAKWASRRR